MHESLDRIQEDIDSYHFKLKNDILAWAKEFIDKLSEYDVIIFLDIDDKGGLELTLQIPNRKQPKRIALLFVDDGVEPRLITLQTVDHLKIIPREPHLNNVMMLCDWILQDDNEVTE